MNKMKAQKNKTNLNKKDVEKLIKDFLNTKNKTNQKPKIIVILGPTASGKSDFGVQLAKKFNGEIVSSDSRQVYRGLDIGSGKITTEEMQGVPHHLLDVASARRTFTVADFQKKAYRAIDDILKRGKLPIIVGGTGFYIQAIVDGIVLPKVKKDSVLRRELEKMSLSQLQKKLQKLDPARFTKIDQKNKVRLIRAIEIANQLEKVPTLKKNPHYNCLQIGISWPKEVLQKRIHDRLLARVNSGMIEEVEKLHNEGVSWRRLEALGLEYRYVARFLQGQISREQMLSELETKICQFSKRQMTWFGRDERVWWVRILIKNQRPVISKQ